MHKSKHFVCVGVEMRDRRGVDAGGEEGWRERSTEKGGGGRRSVCVCVHTVCKSQRREAEKREGGVESEGERDIDRLCCRNWGVLYRD